MGGPGASSATGGSAGHEEQSGESLCPRQAFRGRPHKNITVDGHVWLCLATSVTPEQCLFELW